MATNILQSALHDVSQWLKYCKIKANKTLHITFTMKYITTRYESFYVFGSVCYRPIGLVIQQCFIINDINSMLQNCLFYVLDFFFV